MQGPNASAPVLPDGLDDELVHVLRGLDVPLLEATALQGVGQPGYGAPAFQLRLADGRILKARHFAEEARAVRVEYALRHLHHPCFPQVVARHGRVLLTEWIAGRPLSAADCTPARLRECGALQAFVHRLPIAADAPYPRIEPMPPPWLRLRSRIAELEAAALLQEHEGQQALELAEQYAPDTCAVGLVHNDFCAENIVLTPAGTFSVIDNEMLGVAALEYDLGRTWYRWPMTREQRAAYVDGYRRHRSSEDFERHFYYWVVVATVDGAAFRASAGPQTVSVPLARLRMLLAQAGRDLSPGEAIYCV